VTLILHALTLAEAQLHDALGVQHRLEEQTSDPVQVAGGEDVWAEVPGGEGVDESLAFLARDRRRES
jgi:hypothetical protein